MHESLDAMSNSKIIEVDHIIKELLYKVIVNSTCVYARNLDSKDHPRVKDMQKLIHPTRN